MNAITIRQLNQLNQVFYQHHATSFHQSRQEFWSGWEDLWVNFGQNLVTEVLNTQPKLTVLDVGCGNGRFAQFLEQRLTPDQLPSCEYIGWDNGQELLKLAHRSTLLSKCRYQEADLIELALSDKLGALVASSSADLVVGFGVMHHIPSQRLRIQVLRNFVENLPTFGQTWLSWWQFADEPRYEQKLVSPIQIGLRPEEIELNDWLLGWKSNQDLYRYCHSFTQNEIATSIQGSGCQLQSLFKSNQPGDNLNWYSVVTK